MKTILALRTLLCRGGWSVVLCGTLLIALTTAQAKASEATDIVRLVDDSGNVITRSGTILDYEGRQLTLESSSGRTQKLPSSHVLTVQTTSSDAQQQGQEAFERQQYDTALNHFREAIGQESRRWMKRQILAWMIRSYDFRGDTSRAVQGFLALAQDDPHLLHFEVIPVTWHGAASQRPLQEEAAQWMTGPDALTRLIGASWLLTIRPQQATAVLRQLAGHDDPRVRGLARAQQWRLHVLQADAATCRQWEKELEQLPVSLRAGPHYVLGLALARAEQHPSAVLNFLRVPLLYSEQHPLAAECLWQAAVGMQQQEDRTAARRLYQELMENYPASPLAANAQQRVLELTR